MLHTKNGSVLVKIQFIILNTKNRLGHQTDFQTRQILTQVDLLL